MAETNQREAWVSGIDWSGDPGDPAKPGSSERLVIAMASVQTDRLSQLIANLDGIRRTLHWSNETAFHFVESDRRSRSLFFELIDNDLVIHVLVESKRDWYRSPLPGGASRPSRLLDAAIGSMVGQAPREITAGQAILIDRPRSEVAAMRSTVLEIRAALRTRGVMRMPTIKPLPDHRADAQLIQVADMFAGAISAWGPDDRRLRRLGDRLIVL